MARYEHLPIYKGAMDLALILETRVRNMSRYHKYTLGHELRSRGLRALSLVVRANSVREKEEVLVELRITLEELKQLLFLSKEVKALPSFVAYSEIMDKLEGLSRQNEGWLKSQHKKKSVDAGALKI